MIPWSGQSKTGQTPSRARSRRRGGESDHHARPRVEAMVAPNPVNVRDVSQAPIVVDDDEDDLVESSPRSFAQAIFKARVEAQRSARPSRLPREEDPLELRLGPGGTSEYSRQTHASVSHTGRRGRPARATIDLTTPSRPAPANEDCVVTHEYTKNTKKRKPVPEEPFFIKEVAPPPSPPAPPAPPAPEAAVEHKYKCAICMDTMKDETSTICGHIFCQTCIHGAITSQKKCPTCRRKLTLKNIHRIYL